MYLNQKKQQRSFCIVWVMLCCLMASFTASAQTYNNWARQASRLPDSFFCSDSVSLVLENVLASQLPSGAWSKNVNFFLEREEHPDNVLLGTIDNKATTTEIRFLMRYYAHNQSSSDSYQAAVRGIRYLLNMQYKNGGFPQYYPRRDHYHAYITFNDNAMLNVLCLLDDVARQKVEFKFVPDSLSQRCAEAFQRGVECLLACQIYRNGEPTVWCQQHDPVTLEPQHARAYELPSFVSAESADIVEFLMKLQDPSDKILRAVGGAMKWFREHAIYGMERENFTNEDGLPDFRMKPCPQGGYPCPALWARFYDLETEKPFFCGRDGVPRSCVDEIEYERRNGYAWFVTQPERLFSQYQRWVQQFNE